MSHTISTRNLQWHKESKTFTCEQSILDHKRIFPKRSSNNIWDLLFISNPKTGKFATYIHGPGHEDVIRNAEGEIEAVIYHGESGGPGYGTTLKIFND